MSFNPVRRVFERAELYGVADAMTLEGTLTKIGILLGALATGAAASLYLMATQSSLLMPALAVVFPSALIIAVIAVFWPQTTRYTAFVYALFQGFGLAAFTMALESRYPGIAVASLALTGATAMAMLLLYKLEIIRVNDMMRSVIVSATAAIGLTYLVVMVLGFFGLNTASFYESTSISSILFSLFVVAVAAFNLLLDFALIEECVEGRLPRYMEWYAAFTLLVTLIWLYVEIVRLLSKFARRNE